MGEGAARVPRRLKSVASLIRRRGQLTHPVPDVEEALLAGQIEHQQEAHGVPEERRGQTAEPGTGTTNIPLNLTDGAVDAGTFLHTFQS